MDKDTCTITCKELEGKKLSKKVKKSRKKITSRLYKKSRNIRTSRKKLTSRPYKKSRI
jgi:hypothetical protein